MQFSQIRNKHLQLFSPTEFIKIGNDNVEELINVNFR